MDAEKSVERLIQKAYDSLKASDAAGARRILEEALAVDFEHPEVVYALKCLSWWQERLNRLDIQAPGKQARETRYGGDSRFQEAFDKGGFILSQWKSFYSFLDRISGEGFDNCLYAIRHFVFSAALDHFKDMLGDGENQHDPGLLLQAGRCYKGVGSYEEALRYLEQAVRFKREDGETLSELADVNALMEETRAAKALFREAFFLDPQGIELRNLESELILRLSRRVREMGYAGAELLEWIPVYGALLGVFSVKRELKLSELGKLKQSIFALENETRGRDGKRSPEEGLLVPRLINRYLWLIDHYENVHEDPALIEEIMLKIKLVDPAVYERYRN